MPTPDPRAPLVVTPALLERLDKPVPRYTSYPTADRFHDVDAAVVDAAYARADRDGGPLSLYVHIPFCARMCSYCGCAVVVSNDVATHDAYVDRVVVEAGRVAARLPHRRRVSELQLGGGTPNRLTIAQLTRLVDGLRACFAFDDDALLGIECDPRRVHDRQLQALRDLGFSRVSFGVQDTDEEVQDAIGRHQSVDETRRAVRDARAAGFASVNVDLVYGLPQQTKESFAATVDEVIALAPDRIALFSFAYVPHARPNQRRIPAATLPPSTTKLELFCAARAAFIDAGYVAVGMDHFARPDDALARAYDKGTLTRNFQGYSVAVGDEDHVDVVGLGQSAISDLGGAYLQNDKTLRGYERAVDEGRTPVVRGHALSRDEEAVRFAIRQLMCRFRLDEDALFAATGDHLRRHPQALVRLGALEHDGLVRIERGHVVVTALGRLFVRNIAACFDPFVVDVSANDGDRDADAGADGAPPKRGALRVWSQAV